jgi:glutamyl/glutaminyl-tRNA synthetase
MYDRACLGLSPQDIQDKMSRGEPHTIRLKIPEGKTTVKDLLRGYVQFDHAGIDDQVLMKSDGYPTYHLANVVDDHAMKITHVIRGEEWLPSTPKHVILYKAFGFEPPKWAHLGLLLNEDRSKLSKRQGDVAVEDFRVGFLKHESYIEALIFMYRIKAIYLVDLSTLWLCWAGIQRVEIIKKSLI